MTDEVDPRLVALGLVPAPAATPAPDWETAAPPKPSDWVVPSAPTVATPPPPPPPSHTPSVSMPVHKPLTVGDLFPGMGKFSGTPSAEAPAVPPAPPTFAPAPPTFTPAPPTSPAPQSFAPPAPPPAYTPP